MPAPTIYYLRHGETEWNALGRLQGTQDIALNARGRAQAVQAAGILADLFARDGRGKTSLPYVSSPLGRARQTMEIVRGKLELLEEQKREAELNAATGGKLDMGWGTQIRSYVIYDNRVKDHRTSCESTNPQRVLDGNLAPFIEAELRRRSKGK